MPRISPIRKRQFNRLVRRYGSLPKQVFIVLMLTSLGGLLYCTSFGASSNIQIERLFFSLRGPISPPKDVIIVAIDDRSYKELDASTSYPLPRKYLATGIESIVDSNPRVLFADLKFPDDRVYDADSDRRIVDALTRAPTTIWTGREDDRPETEVVPSGAHFRAAAKLELDMFIEGSHGYLYGASDSSTQRISLPSGPIGKHSAGDLKKKLKARSPIGNALVELGGYSIVPPAANALINFYGPSKTVPYVSIADLIKGDVSTTKQKIANKVVLIGYLSKQFMKGILNRDEFMVPSDPSGMFGVEVHSHLIGNLIENSWILRLDPVDEILFVGLFTFIFAAAAVKKATPAVVGFVFLTPIFLLGIGYFAFFHFRFFVPGIAVIATMAYLITAPSIIHFMLRSQRFNRYINKQMKIETEHEI